MLIFRFADEVPGQPVDVAAVMDRAKAAGELQRATNEVLRVLVVRARLGIREVANAEIAARAGISTSKVSAAMHELQRRGVLRLEHIVMGR